MIYKGATAIYTYSMLTWLQPWSEIVVGITFCYPDKNRIMV